MAEHNGEAAISVTVTENGKAKRGRPPLFSADIYSTFRWLYGQGKDRVTRRTLQNYSYLCVGAGTLMEAEDKERFSWLLEGMDGDKFKRRSLLMELGRLGDEDAIRGVAEIICKEKPTSRRGRAIIRACRSERGTLPQATRKGLFLAIAKAIHGYVGTHVCEDDDDMILDALNDVYSAFQETGEGGA